MALTTVYWPLLRQKKSNPLSYKLRLEEPIYFGHTQPPGGSLRCELQVSFRAHDRRSSHRLVSVDGVAGERGSGSGRCGGPHRQRR